MSGKKSRQRGKSNELATAKFWGMKRNHFESEDLTGHPVISVECKARCSKQSPKMILEWYAQARSASSEGKIAVVHYHTMGTHRDEDLVIMRAHDLRDLIGRGSA